MLGRIEGRRRRGCREWDGRMASLTQWMWVWPSSRRSWGTGRPGVLQSMGSQRVGQDWATGQQQQRTPPSPGRLPSAGQPCWPSCRSAPPTALGWSGDFTAHLPSFLQGGPGATGAALSICHRDWSPWSVWSPPDHPSTACSQAQLGERCWAQLPCPEQGWTPPCTEFALQSTPPPDPTGARRVTFDLKRPLLHKVPSLLSCFPTPLLVFSWEWVPNNPPGPELPHLGLGSASGTPETVTPAQTPEAVSTASLLTPGHLELSFSVRKEFCFYLIYCLYQSYNGDIKKSISWYSQPRAL